MIFCILFLSLEKLFPQILVRKAITNHQIFIPSINYDRTELQTFSLHIKSRTSDIRERCLIYRCTTDINVRKMVVLLEEKTFSFFILFVWNNYEKHKATEFMYVYVECGNMIFLFARAKYPLNHIMYFICEASERLHSKAYMSHYKMIKFFLLTSYFYFSDLWFRVCFSQKKNSFHVKSCDIFVCVHKNKEIDVAINFPQKIILVHKFYVKRNLR